MVARDPSLKKPVCTSSPQAPNGSPALHLIGTISRRQRISVRNIAQNWGVDVTEIRNQQDDFTDLKLSQLYRWQKVLKVPLNELLVDHDEPVSDTVRWRAQLIKAMKTVVLIQQTAREPRVKWLVANLIDQLTQLMPELAEVGPCHGSGAHRGFDDLGRAAFHNLSEDLLRD